MANYEKLRKDYSYVSGDSSAKIKGYMNVKSALTGIAKNADAKVSIGVVVSDNGETAHYTVFYNSNIPGSNTVVKKNVSPTDAMIYIAYLKGDKTALRLNVDVKRTLNQTTVAEAYESVLLQVSLSLGGRDKIDEAHRALLSHIAQSVGEEKHFDSEALTLIAIEFLPGEDGKKKKKKDIKSEDRIRTLNALKSGGVSIKNAVKNAGYQENVIEEAAKYCFVSSKRFNANDDKVTIMTLRKIGVNPPSYMEGNTKQEMRKRPDGVFEDPREPEDKPVAKKASGPVSIRATHVPTSRSDPEYEAAVRYLMEKLNWDEKMARGVPHTQAKEHYKKSLAEEAK